MRDESCTVKMFKHPRATHNFCIMLRILIHFSGQLVNFDRRIHFMPEFPLNEGADTWLYCITYSILIIFQTKNFLQPC